MNYKIVISDVQSTGAFSIYTKQLDSIEFILFEENVRKDDLIAGKVITIPNSTQQIKVINNTERCGSVSKIIDVVFIPPPPSSTPTATPTPTPSTTPVIPVTVTPTPTPTRTPTPSASPAAVTGTLELSIYYNN